MGPAIVAAAALLFAAHSYRRFEVSLQWENLPFDEIIKDPDFVKRRATCEKYEQPELTDPPDGDGSDDASGSAAATATVP